ncbi:MAG: hypothetical protein JXO22_01095 [Phycisphaerae bacterium]|nr:hypothetical protein [Phycisphaerae bacterium]
MRTLLISVLITACTGALTAWAAEDTVASEMQRDVVLRALVDELDRNMSGLKLEGLEQPYFIEYGLTDAQGAYVSASLGAIVNRMERRSRGVQTDVRVGSYELDNTNYQADDIMRYLRMAGGSSSVVVPLEDDYEAIRQAVWWATDREYKDVVEQFVQKKAFMASKMIEDKPDDFSRVSPTVYFEDRADMTVDLPRMEQLAIAVSEVFRAYPDIQSSSVTISSAVGNVYLVNSEGTRMRTAQTMLSLSVGAATQADDGMKLNDWLDIYAHGFAELPPQEELVEQCRTMADKLIALKNAPVLDAYTGPVLFEPEAAAAVFSRQFGRSFGGGQRPLGSRTEPDDFANKLGRPILPRFMSVVDDPTHTVINDVPVMGHYTYDDQGVKAETVSLVEQGELTSLLMSRNPSKEFTQSNGHGRGALGADRGVVGCLVVTAAPALTADDMKQQLLDACDDEGIDFGIRIESVGESSGGGPGGGMRGRGRMPRGFGGGDRGLSVSPLLMYKVYADGHEELVRGAEISQINTRAFKNILAAGDTPCVLNSGGRDVSTYAVPALLFEELDMAKVDRDFDTTPILPAPLTRQ